MVVSLFATAAPAPADHEIERVEGAGWDLVDDRGGAIRIERTAGNSFAAYVTETMPNECFTPGTLVYEFSGHEPEYAGSEYVAVVDEDDNCTGEFRRISAEFSLTWDPRTLRFSGAADNRALSWEKPRVDTDSDGLYDDEELSGINIPAEPGGGISPETEVDLRAMGADPERKDLFVEVDEVAGHPMRPETVAKMAAIFDQAPVPNPGGGAGISLHIDAGPDTLMDVRSGRTWGELSESQNTLPHNFFTDWNTNDDPWPQFEDLKARYFDRCPPSGILCDSARSLAFRYVVVGHVLPNATAGETQGVPALGIQLGYQCREVRTECNADVEDQTAIFFHELGHALGLQHGGAGDTTNFKPNHFSSMNYSYAYGLPTPGGEVLYDYTGWDGSAVPQLDEHALNERQGVRASLPRPMLSIVWCQRSSRKFRVGVNRPADFDCDGDRAGTVAADISHDRRRSVLTTNNEWASLVLDPRFLVRWFGLWRQGAPPSPPPEEDARIDDTRPLIYGDPKKPKLVVKQARRGGNVKVTFKAKDNQRLERLIVDLGRPVDEYLERSAKGRRVSATTRVPKGTRVGAVALDHAGNARERRFRAG